MAQPQTDRAEVFGLQDIVRQIKSDADRRADAAAETAREAAEAEYFARLHQEYDGQTLFCYDQSHENRFVRKGICEWNSVGFSFKECVDKARKHIFRYHGEEHWLRVERQLEGISEKALPTLEPEQLLVFQAGSYWYCFFCVTGADFCELVRKKLAELRKHDALQERQCQREGIDTDFN